MKKTFLIILPFLSGWIATVLVLADPSINLERPTAGQLVKPPEHGTALVVEADFSQTFGATNMVGLEEALRRRLSGLGTLAYVESVSKSRLRIALPVSESNEIESVQETIAHRGILEFRLVNDNSHEIIKNNQPIPPGYELMRSLQKMPGQQSPESLVVRSQAENGLVGALVQSAWVLTNTLGNLQIELTFNEGGAARFARLTTEYAPSGTNGLDHRLAIIVDGNLYSAPIILEPILSGSCAITGGFTDQEAHELAQVLNSPLPAAVKIVEMRSF